MGPCGGVPGTVPHVCVLGMVSHGGMLGMGSCASVPGMGPLGGMPSTGLHVILIFQYYMHHINVNDVQLIIQVVKR